MKTTSVLSIAFITACIFISSYNYAQEYPYFDDMAKQALFEENKIIIVDKTEQKLEGGDVQVKTYAQGYIIPYRFNGTTLGTMANRIYTKSPRKRLYLMPKTQGK